MGRRFLPRGAGREHQRREPVERVLDGHVGAAIEQDLDDLEMSMVARVEERRRVVAELRVDVDPFVEERLHGRGVPLARRVLQLFRFGQRRRLREQERGGQSDEWSHGVGLMAVCGWRTGACRLEYRSCHWRSPARRRPARRPNWSAGPRRAFPHDLAGTGVEGEHLERVLELDVHSVGMDVSGRVPLGVERAGRQTHDEAGERSPALHEVGRKYRTIAAPTDANTSPR